MTTFDLKKERIVSLLNKDFASMKRDVITFLQAYASGSFSDFNETSPGMAVVETQAFIGDILSFYLDQQYNELRDSTAVQIKNVQANAKMRGYRPFGKRPSRGLLSFVVEVPSKVNSTGEVIPDDSYTPILAKGSQGTANNGIVFETLEDIPFSASLNRAVTGSQFDSTTGLPTHFGLMKTVEVVSGRTVTETFSVTGFSPFKRIELSNSDVIEVIDVVDSQTNEWIEVDHLAQDWVFSDATNENDIDGTVPYVLKIKTAPRRFIVDCDIVTGKSTLIFGSGDGSSFDDDYVPNLGDLALPLAGRRTYSSFSVDPQNLLKTRSFGLSPHNTTLTVRYRVGGGQESNVAEMAIRQVSSAGLSFGSSGLAPLVKARVEGSIGCINEKRMTGGAPAESVREIKLNASAWFATQNRAVTREDVVARVLSMPTKFGKPEKVFVKTTPNSRFSYDIHVLSKDSSSRLTIATPTLKSNIVTYINKYRMLTDEVNVLDARIIDLRLNFSLVSASKVNRSEVLTVCLGKLIEYFDVDRMQIGAPIVLSDVISFIQSTPGVVSVSELSFSNVFGLSDGRTYSDVRFDVSAARSDGMIICPTDSIFNFSFPRRDIGGSSK